MGLFRRRSTPDDIERSGWWNLAGVPGLISSAYYGAPSVDQALRNAATWACIDVLADSIASTPFDAVRPQRGVRIPVEPTPAILSAPSAVADVDVWLYQMAWSLVTDGNAFGVVLREQRGLPSQIEWLDPTAVTDRKVVDGVAQVRHESQTSQLWPEGDIFHVPGRVVPPGSPFGLSLVSYASRAIGVSLSAEDFSHRFFTDGAHPTAIITADTPLSQEQAQAVKDAYRRAVNGGGEPAVFGSGLSYQSIQMQPGQTQYLDILRFEVEQACRFWRVPPSMVYAAVSGQNVTYSNVTQADLHYLKHSLDGYLVRVERALSRCLPKPQVVKANRNAILRGDVAGRYAAYAVALENRFTTVNEVRALEDLPAFGGDFDTPGIPPL